MGSPTWGGENTLVRLPARTLRPCRLELGGRCFLELAAPAYEDNTLAALISGTVVVSGKISRAGRPVGIHIQSSFASNVRHEPVSADELVRVAVENVRTWRRLEEADHETLFETAFEFSVTDELSDLSLEYQLPGKISIRGKPSLLRYGTEIRDRGVVKGNGLRQPPKRKKRD
jgi:hypothetical protein